MLLEGRNKQTILGLLDAILLAHFRCHNISCTHNKAEIWKTRISIFRKVSSLKSWESLEPRSFRNIEKVLKRST